MTVDATQVEEAIEAAAAAELSGEAPVEPDDDEVEVPLDAILARQLEEPVFDDEDDEELWADPDSEREWQFPVFVARARPDEFVCDGCHLIKRRSQFEATANLCHDCVITGPSPAVVLGLTGA
ncbi:MAG TPA: DUF4193 family protein [Acidimicrobiales bacterium]|nr:DUF4193 family protein [Acidimicrobiales bacterium]